MKLATNNTGNDSDISDYAGFVQSSLNDTLKDADIKGFSDSNDKDNLQIKQDAETDDKELILAKLQYDPEGPGGSRSDYVASAVRTAFDGKSIHVKDRSKLEADVKKRIFTTALDPMKSCSELGIKTSLMDSPNDFITKYADSEGSMYNHIVGESATKEFNKAPVDSRRSVLVKLATKNVDNDVDISDYAGFVESSLSDTLEDADIKGFSDSNGKRNLKIKKDSETDDKELIIAKFQYDPDGPGGSGSDYVASAVRTAFDGKSIHVKDRKKLEADVKKRIFTTAFNPMKECDELGIKTNPIEEDMNGKIFYDSRVFGPTGDFL